MLYIHLIKKNILLIKNQLFLLIAVSFVIPVILCNKIDNSFIIFLMMTNFSEYFMYSAIAVLEEKYHGQKYLCITSYTRQALVILKYIFVNFVFLLNLVLYILLSKINFIQLNDIKLNSIFYVLCIVNVLFAIFIPIEYRFGYTNSQYILMLMLVFIPTWGIGIFTKVLSFFNLNIPNPTSFLEKWGVISSCILTICLFVLSQRISLKIFAKKDF